MKPALRRPPVLYLLVAGALLLLPIMAALQYRWIGQVSDAERERRQRSLQQATRQVAQDLDLELVRAFVGLQVDGDSLQAEVWDGYAERVRAWRTAAAAPAMVAGVLLADEHDDALRLRRWDASAASFVTTEWPADLLSYRTRFLEERERWVDDPPHRPLRPADLLNDTDDALVVPVAPISRLQRERTVFRPMFGYTIIRLDTAFVKNEFLPALIERHFRQGADEYRVAVVNRRDPARVVYAGNAEDVTDLMARHDASADLFGLRPDQFALLRTASGSLRGSGSPSGESRRSLFFSFMLRRGPGERPDADVKTFEELMRWKLVARHRAGSLEAAVTAARTRNVLLSSGILLLMAASVAVLARTARRAERLARQQIEFVAAVSHELRTPVSVIGAAAENLADGVVSDPSRIRQYGARIQTEARRLGETVERVLLYAGIEAGRAVAHRSPVDVGGIINDALTGSADTIAQAGVSVETDVPSGLPPVLADAGALRSSVTNLIANAIKYGGASGWVKISATSAQTRSGPEVRIAVSDKGLGIAPGDLPHIFEPFYRGAEAQARQIHGNGLGLSIVKGIVEAHGGRVSVQSAPGAGSTFVIHLPACRAEPSIEATALTPEHGSVG